MVGVKELLYIALSYTAKKNKMPAGILLPELEKRLDNHEPFVAGKIGGFELWAMRVAEFGYTKENVEVYDKLCNNAGFFSCSNDISNDLRKYTEVMKKTIGNVDYLIRWQYPKEEYFIRRYCSEEVKDIDWLGVVYQNHPIGRILMGRKVLVVTPFDEEVRDQYKVRTQVYGEDYLPEFSLRTFKAVQTIAGTVDARFCDWFEALEYMCNRIIDIDFDVALVGCGAYSLPICAAIKDAGKSAIHMGGDVQLLFGIMGKRWEDNEFVNTHKNSSWIYPYEGSVPVHAGSVEDGCYW